MKMLHKNMHTHHTHCLHTYMCFTLAQFSVTLPAVNTALQMHLLLLTCLKLNKKYKLQLFTFSSNLESKYELQLFGSHIYIRCARIIEYIYMHMFG